MDAQEQALQFYNYIGFKKLLDMRLPFEHIHKPLSGMQTLELSL